MSAIAEAAGVTRLTVYRHFPDDSSLIVACSNHWSNAAPRPDVSTWLLIPDPVVRLRTALRRPTDWARTAAPMMTMIQRDLDVLPAFRRRSFIADDEQAARRRLGRALPRRGCLPATAHCRHHPRPGHPDLGVPVPRGRLSDADAVHVMEAAVTAAR